MRFFSSSLLAFICGVSGASALAQSDAQASASGSAIVNNSVAITATGGPGGTVGNITVEAQKARPTSFLGVTPITPPLPALKGQPANAAGVDVTMAFLAKCPVKVTHSMKPVPIVGKGSSGGTHAYFAPHDNVARYATSGKDHPVYPDVDVATFDDPQNPPKGKCLCLGLLQIEGDMPLMATLNDAALFIAEKLVGFPSVMLIAVPGQIAVNYGTNSDSSGLSAGGLLSVLGISGGKTKGTTFQGAVVGTTFLVVGEEVPTGASGFSAEEFMLALKRQQLASAHQQ